MDPATTPASPHNKLVATLLAALCRLERAGIPPQPRLLEPDLARWHHIRRRLGYRDFVELLLDDAAQAFPVPFDIKSWRTNPLGGLDESAARALIENPAAPLDTDALTYLRDQAAFLDQPTGGRLADLPRILPRERVLELPGTNGRAASYLCRKHDDLSFDGNFTFVVDSDAARLLVGLAAVELRANPPTLLTPDDLSRVLAGGAVFDRAIGLEKHGPAAQIAEKLPASLPVIWV